LALSHNTLANYYTTIFAMAQHHKYSITEIEDMMPFERDLYIDLLLSFLDKQKEKLAEDL
jgi:hypothetical protein